MSRTRASLTALLVGALALGLSTLLPAEPATAFKPYTHVVVGHMAMTDAIDDGRVTIGGRSYAVRPKIVEALRAWPSYFRAGTVGPDGFPDLTYGQSVIHPDRTGEWLRYLLREAWAAQSDKSYTAAEKGQILAFTYGFLSHAASDVWAHTLINDFAQGVFPEAPEILTSVPKAAIALRHIIVEGYVGDATIGFDGNPQRTTLGSGDVSDDSTPGLSMDAPTRWLYRTLVDPRVSLPSARCRNGQDEDEDGVADDGCFGAGPYRRGDAEQSRGPLIDHFLDLQSDLQLKQALLRADMNHRNCALSLDRDCKSRVRDVWVDTVRGKRHGQITIKRCEARYFCYGFDATDFAEDKLLSKAWMAYLDNWVDDIESGLRAWGQLGLATTRGLFDPQARRNLQNEKCSKYAESTETRAQCEAGIGVVDVVMHQARPFITGHLLSMLGAPDATGVVLEALKALSKLIDSLLPYNPLRVALDELEKKAKDLILQEVRRVVGIDLATLNHMLKNPSAWMEVEQIQLDLGPKLGVRSVNLFPPGTRDRLDVILGLTPQDRVTTTVPMPNGSTRTVGVLSDSAVMRNAAPYDNAITLGKLLLLDANGLNRAITDSLVAQGVMKEGAYARVYRDGGTTPANVMVDGLSGGDPWLKLIDGDHVWRKDGKPRFTSGEGHGGNGNFPLWESCLVRPAFGGTFFRDWENGGLAFPALGDGTNDDWADTSAPTGGINVLAPSYLRKGKKMAEQMRFLGVGMLELTASDTIFSDIAVKQKVVVKRLTTQTSQYFTNYGQLPLVDTEGEDDGYRSITQSVGDPCNAMVQRKQLTFTLDTLGPEVTILSPEEGLVVDSAERIPILWSIADQGPWKWVSGLDEEQTVAIIGDRPAPQNGTFGAFGLYPGTQSLEITGADRVENTGGGFRFFEVQATSASLLKNVAQGAASQAFPSSEMRVVLEGLLTNAADAHAANDHVAEGDALSEARQMLSDQRGLGVAEWYADLMIAHIDDLVSRHIPPEG